MAASRFWWRLALLLPAAAWIVVGGGAAPPSPPPARRLARTPGGRQQPASTQHRLELSTEYFLVPERSLPMTPAVKAGVVLVTRNPCPPGGRGDYPGCETKTPVMTSRNWTSVSKSRIGLLRRESWVIPLLVFAALTMLLIAGFEVFVLCKAVRTTPSRRHLFLGQMLLLGLFLCAALGATLAATPTAVTCATVRFGTGVAYAVVFAALLVKCVFLISLNGGVYLPAPYQALLLFFAVLIQVAVGTQWLVNAPPRVVMVHVESVAASSSHHHRLVVTAEDLLEEMVTSLPLCHTPYQDVLFSLMYVMCLIVFVAILAVKSRGIRDNYREATFIGLSVGCTIPIWVVWVLCGLVVPDRHRDACLAYGLVTTSSVVFLVMFMPKGRQLAAMGKEGVYIEDREDRFSSLSRAGSGYSPSFFHFKPNKYGVVPGGGGPPISISAAQHKHQQSTVTTMADRVALVAPPPSYTRMYHYYPYCYYPRYQGGVYLKPEDVNNVYTTLEPTLSANPNVFFQRGGVHPGMMY